MQRPALAPLRFDLQEAGGALADLGTLLPLTISMIVVNGLDATVVLALMGLLYIGSGLYFRIPMPVQPLKAMAAISIARGLSPAVIGAAGLLMGGILGFLALTNLVSTLVGLFPKPVVRGMQLSIGLVLMRKGLELAVGDGALIAREGAAGATPFPVGALLAAAALAVFLVFKLVISRQSQHLSPSLALVTFGLGLGVVIGPVPSLSWLPAATFSPAIPSAGDFWSAFSLLVIPQLPLTFGNAVVGTWDTARTYFQERASRVTPRALTASMALANCVAGLAGGIPLCHGAGGLTAHHKLGARSGAASIMIGALLLVVGIAAGHNAPSLLALMPLAVLGVMLVVVGAYHSLLVRDMAAVADVAVVALVGLAAILANNLAIGFVAGTAMYYAVRYAGARRGARSEKPA